jgi:hypothetical protein
LVEDGKSDPYVYKQLAEKAIITFSNYKEAADGNKEID